jgi:hypothetical protein
MLGHVVLFTAIDSGLCLAHPVQTGYRTRSWDPQSCLFIGYSVSTREKPPELDAHHTFRSPNLRIMCCIPLLSICCHGLYMHHLTPLYFTISPTSQHAPAVVFVTIRCSQFTPIRFLSLYHIQPVYTDTFLVPLPHTASLHRYFSCPSTTYGHFTL